MKIRKELWFGLIIMGLIVLGAAYVLLSAETVTRGHLGLLMLSLVVVAIMLGFPTAFTLMGMGMIFTWLAYDRDITRTLDLMVQAAFRVMSSDVLISIPLFVFMGYLVERANLIDKLFKSLHLALARVPGSLAVATLFTCAVFATATGIVGAVVTLMGLLAFPQMLKAGYSTRLGAGAITAGGCLGILIPPSVLLIVYGATAGVSVVQLYAGAFFPGIMLAGLYILYVMILAWFRPDLAPPLSAEQRYVACRRSRNASPTRGRTARCRPAARTQGPRQCRRADRPAARAVVHRAAAAVVLRPGDVRELPGGHAPRRGRNDHRSRGHGRRTDEDLARRGRRAGAVLGGGVQEPPSDSGCSGTAGGERGQGCGRRAACSGRTAGSQVRGARQRDAARVRGAAQPPGGLVDHARCRPRAARVLRDLHVPAARDLQDAAGVVLPAPGTDLAVLGSIVFGLATPTEPPRSAPSAATCWRRSTCCSTTRAEIGRASRWDSAMAAGDQRSSGSASPSLRPVPTWFGVLSIAGVAIWSVIAVFQAGLVGTVASRPS